MEQNDSERPIRPLLSMPGMKLWLLIALHLGCYGVILLLMRFDAFAWLSADQETSTPSIAKWGAGFFTVFTFLIPAVIFANAVLPERFYYYKLHRKVNLIPAFLGVLAILVSVFFIDMVESWNISWITDPQQIELRERTIEYSNWAQQMPGVSDLIVLLLVSAVAPAVCEELFFRGGIQQQLMEWIRNPHAAILITAAIFSFLHFDLFGFVARFLLGAALGYLFWWSGSLRLNILAHFAFNGFMIINEYIVQHAPESWWSKLETTYVMAVISLVVSLGALLTCRNLLSRKRSTI